MIPPFDRHRSDTAVCVNEFQLMAIGYLAYLEKGFIKMLFIGYIFVVGCQKNIQINNDSDELCR